MAPDREQYLAKKARLVSLVIAGTMLIWIGGQWLSSMLGIDTRYRILLDLSALAGFVWAMVVIYQIWRARRNS